MFYLNRLLRYSLTCAPALHFSGYINLKEATMMKVEFKMSFRGMKKSLSYIGRNTPITAKKHLCAYYQDPTSTGILSGAVFLLSRAIRIVGQH